MTSNLVGFATDVMIVECGICGQERRLGPKTPGPMAWMTAHQERWHPGYWGAMAD